MRKGLVTMVALIAVALAGPVLAGQVFDHYEVRATYTLPVPPGGTAVKRVTKVGGPYANYADAAAAQALVRETINGLRDAYVAQPPPRGWAPFAGGADLVIIWREDPNAP